MDGEGRRKDAHRQAGKSAALLLRFISSYAILFYDLVVSRLDSQKQEAGPVAGELNL